MPGSRVRLQVWCEDRSHERFVRELFEQRYGLTRRDMRVMLAPKGRGSASEWVIANFAEAIRVARTGKNQQRMGVLVVVDGDAEGVLRRKTAMLQPAHGVRDDLRLAIWVPTRNIETWIKYLSGPDAATTTEETDYKHEVERDLQVSLQRAVASWRKTTDESCLPSLRDAYDELDRLPVT